MKKAATSACSPSHCTGTSQDNYCILLCSKSALWVFPISSQRILKGYILKCQDLITLIIFTAATCTFLNETGFCPPEFVWQWRVLTANIVWCHWVESC